MRSVSSARNSARIVHRLALLPCRPPHYQSTALSASSVLHTAASPPSTATRASSSPSSPAMSLLPQHMAGFMQRVAECNTGLEELPLLTPLVIEGQTVGKLKAG